MHTRKLEKIVKGFSNHRRIEIINELDTHPNISLQSISERLNINIKTAGEHVRRLHIAGLVTKKNRGASVEHKLSALGNLVLKFLRTLE